MLVAFARTNLEMLATYPKTRKDAIQKPLTSWKMTGVLVVTEELTWLFRFHFPLHFPSFCFSIRLGVRVARFASC